jgi:3-keto-disaccharide hydrolase
MLLPASGAVLSINFDDAPIDQQPPGFTNVLYGTSKPGDWKVIMDEVAPLIAPATTRAPVVTRRPVVAQLSRNPTDERYPILLYDKETFGDFTLTTRFKMVDGVMEQMAGVVFRAQDENNFYVIRADAIGDTLRFYKVINGERAPMLGPKIDFEPNVWYELKIECKGNQIRAWLDGKEALPLVTDSSFTAGKIGFWTKSDAISYFSGFEMNYTLRVPLLQSVLADTLKKYSRLVGLRIATAANGGEPTVAASNDPVEVGAAGTDSEKEAIASGAIFFGRGKKDVTVIMPLRDRNGVPVAAVTVKLKTFRGQTENNALDRARPIVMEMQRRVQFSEDLLQ